MENPTNSPAKVPFVVVTGSTLGIGKAIAEAFCKKGAKVVVNGRSADSTQKVAKELEQKYPAAKVLAIAADVSKAEGSVRQRFFFLV